MHILLCDICKCHVTSSIVVKSFFWQLRIEKVPSHTYVFALCSSDEVASNDMHIYFEVMLSSCALDLMRLTHAYLNAYRQVDLGYTDICALSWLVHQLLAKTFLSPSLIVLPCWPSWCHLLLDVKITQQKNVDFVLLYPMLFTACR